MLLALGQSAELARGSLRITLGKGNTAEEVEYLLEELVGLVEQLRQLPTLTTSMFLAAVAVQRPALERNGAAPRQWLHWYD